METVVLENGKQLSLRRAVKEDAPRILEYLRMIGGESDYLTFGADEMRITQEQEESFIEGINSSINSILVIALIEGAIAGMTVVRGGERSRTQHAGDLGITVRRERWGLGIGRAMLVFVIRWAGQGGVIRKISLKVRNDNVRAIMLYEKNGFKKEGELIRDICIDGQFYDAILMGLKIN